MTFQALRVSIVSAMLLANAAMVMAQQMRQYTLDISNADVSPDGDVTRSAIVVNGASRGPLLVANKGDGFSIDVENHLSDAGLQTETSVHWHGIFQHGTPWADGPVGVTQCPIPQGASFNYNFFALNEAGTFWYHSHLGVQYCDGLRGPIVVYDPQDPHTDLYDEDNADTIITLEDWFHTRADQSSPPHNPAATLINGVGRSAGGPAIPLAIVNVQRGRRYRLRLVNMACGTRYVFAIQDHPLQVIEVDGQDVQPVMVEGLEIFAAQRYSFVLNANQAVDNYWIRANPSPSLAPAVGGDRPLNFENGVNSAILRYQGAASTEPSSTAFLLSNIRVLNLLNELDLHPFTNPQAPGTAGDTGVDVSINLPIAFENGKFTMNGVSFVMPEHPVLLQIFNGQDPDNLLPTGSVYRLPANKVIQVSFPIQAPGIGAPHPIHLHGHAFSVVRGAGSLTYNYDDPVRRDVVNTGLAGDNVTIRFVTDNPGPWFLHCHIEWHIKAGLGVVFAEDPENTQNLVAPQAWLDLCPAPN